MSSVKIYPTKPTDVYLFGTCLIDLFYPDAGVDTVRLLEREGIRVHVPVGQTCCGQPAYTSGYHDESRQVARAQLDLFPQAWPIIVPSGSCGGMMRHHYPALFADYPEQANALAVSERIWELTDFLVNVCKVNWQSGGDTSSSGDEPEPVALHTSCSARREMAVGDAPRQLLEQVPGTRVVTQERVAECCGFGGTFAVRHAEVSEAMVQDKVKALTDTGTRQFASTDCGCLMNIQGYADAQRRDLKGEHIASYLWRNTQSAEMKPS